MEKLNWLLLFRQNPCGDSAKGLEAIRAAATEIIKGAAAVEQSVQEAEEGEEQADDGHDTNEAI